MRPTNPARILLPAPSLRPYSTTNISLWPAANAHKRQRPNQGPPARAPQIRAIEQQYCSSLWPETNKVSVGSAPQPCRTARLAPAQEPAPIGLFVRNRRGPNMAKSIVGCTAILRRLLPVASFPCRLPQWANFNVPEAAGGHYKTLCIVPTNSNLSAGSTARLPTNKNNWEGLSPGESSRGCCFANVPKGPDPKAARDQFNLVENHIQNFQFEELLFQIEEMMCV